MFDLPTAKNPCAQSLSAIADQLAKYISHGIDPAQFLAMVVAEANTLSYTLSQNEMDDPRTKASFAKAAFNAAVVGLLPGPALGHCYFVPYKRNKKATNPALKYTEIVYIPGYKGFLELAFANRFLVQCDPEVVLVGEYVERGHTQDGPWIKHDIPCPRGQTADRKTVVGVYCTYRTSRGGKGTVYMDRSEIDAIDTNYNIWLTDYVAMCLKSPIRRAAKRWQITRQMAAAILLDEAVDADRPQPALGPVEDGVGVDTIDLDSLQVPSDE